VDSFEKLHTAETSALKMEVVCSSEMLVSTYKSTWCYNPETYNYIFTAVRTSNAIWFFEVHMVMENSIWNWRMMISGNVMPKFLQCVQST
jgi:hypothetical protein